MNDLITKTQKGYSLVDSGDQEKLERFGDLLVIRPETQALWPKKNGDIWTKAGAIFSKDGWSLSKSVPNNLPFEINKIKTQLVLGKGRNIGVFPEYAGECEIFQKLLAIKNSQKSSSITGPWPRVLNLFAYTGVSSTACALAGAEVVHVDSSRTSNETAKKTAEENGVDKKIRFITEDSLSFAKREVRRGNKYDLIVLDPPVFGRGPKGQVFKLEDQILPIVNELKQLLTDDALGIFLNGYASEYSPESYRNILETATGMETIAGNLSIEEEGGRLKLTVGKWAFAFKNEEIKGIILGQIKS